MSLRLKNPSGDLPAVKRGSQRDKLREGGNRRPLGREPIRWNLDEILGYVRDKVIPVTGAAGR